MTTFLKTFRELFTPIFRKLRKVIRKLLGEFPESNVLFPVNATIQREKLVCLCYKSNEKQIKLWEGFGEISEIPKIHEKFPRKFSGKFPENLVYFLIQIRCYRVKSILLLTRKVVKTQENFGKLLGKIFEMSKIPGRDFSGKFPENSGCFFGQIKRYSA